MRYIRVAAGTTIAMVASTPPTIPPSTPATPSRRHIRPAPRSGCSARRGLRDREDVGELGVGQPVIAADRAQCISGSTVLPPPIDSNDSDPNRPIATGRSSCTLRPLARPAQIRLSGARMARVSSSGQRSTPLSTNAARNRPPVPPTSGTLAGLDHHGQVSATAAAEAPCRAPLTAGTSLNVKYTNPSARMIATGIRHRPINAATAPAMPLSFVPTNTARFTWLARARCGTWSSRRGIPLRSSLFLHHDHFARPR